MPSKYSMTAMIFVMMLSFYYFSRHVSAAHPPLLRSGPSIREAELLSNAGFWTQYGT